MRSTGWRGARLLTPGVVFMILMLGVTAACGGRRDGDPRPRDRGVGDRTVEPVVSPTEIIVGRTVSDGDVVLLTDGDALVRIDPLRNRAERTRLSGLQPTERPWGLGGLEDGTLWTLLTRDTLGRLARDGSILQRIELDAPQLGLFGWKDRLVYQPVRWELPARALEQSVVGGRRLPFGILRLRPFHSSRPEMLAYNLVMCGIGLGEALPCWFRDGASVERVRSEGSDGPRRLTEISWRPPAAGANIEDRRRPIRDVVITRTEAMWALCTTADDPGDDADVGLGRRLLRYDSSDVLVEQLTLSEPARLILTARDRLCYLLTARGSVMRIQGT